jgi:hypothetical protein
MKLLSEIRYAGTFAFFVLLFAAPAFAQFEVSPDHFEDQPPAKAKVNAAKKKAVTTANSSSQAAARKNAARKPGAPSVASNSGKPHPGRKGNSNSALATKKDSAAPSLKAQASAVRRE